MWKYLALILAMLIQVGCVEGPCEKKYGTCPSLLDEDQEDSWRGENLHSTVTIDPKLTPVETEAVLGAAESWSAATGGRVKITLVIGEEGHLPPYNVVLRARPGALKQGELAATGTTILVLGAGLDSNPFLRSVLVHEFGHYLGLGHEPDLLDDIMYPTTHDGMPDSPTPDAVADLGVLYDW